MLRRLICVTSVLVLLLGVLFGCGGGGGGGTTHVGPTQSTAAPAVSVDWPLRTRNLIGPSSALSVKIVLASTVAGQPSVEIDGNRASNLAAHTETYSASGTADVGTYTMTATFYAAANLQGAVVATAAANVAVPSGGLSSILTALR